MSDYRAWISTRKELKPLIKHALDAKITDAKFQLADVNQRLPFDDETFDAVMCINSMNHFRDRLAYLKEWHRVLKPGKRALFTDPVVITGPVSNEELAARSNIGFFLFVPLEVTTSLIKAAGFRLIRCEDVTGNIELTSKRWHASRQKHRDDLIKIEGKERFDGLQKFFSTVHKLTSERRLSRFVFRRGEIMKLEPAYPTAEHQIAAEAIKEYLRFQLQNRCSIAGQLVCARQSNSRQLSGYRHAC